MKLQDVLKIAALLLLPGLSPLHAAAPVFPLSEHVAVETWTRDFETVRGLAESNNRPVVVFVDDVDDRLARRARTAFRSRAFFKWVRKSDIYLVRTTQAEAARYPQAKAALDFVLGAKGPKIKPPYVGVYWPGGTNGEVRTVFTAYPGLMPGDKNPQFAHALLSALDTVLASYFGRLPGRRTYRQIIGPGGDQKAVQTKGAEPEHMEDEAEPDLEPAVWTKDFRAALKQAESTRRPMIMFIQQPGCTYCRRLHNALEGEAFRKWAQDERVYLVRVNAGMTNVSDVAESAVKFAEIPWDKKTGFPYVSVYWTGGTNGVLKNTFTARRGIMPGAAAKTLDREFLNAMDIVLAEYLKSDKTYAGAGAIIGAGTKRIHTGVDGSGSVEMDPKSGELRDAKSTVVLTATPGEGHVFVGWRRKGEQAVFSTETRLQLRYADRQGLYIAVFKKQ